MIKFVTLFILCISYVACLDNGLALTPPMGWNSWNHFQCNTNCTADPNNCLNEKLFMQMADAMVESGMAAAGYEYINMDDCWLATTRNASGYLMPDPNRFPSGIKFLADYVHSKGLKFGIYEDVGNTTCEQFPGSNYHEAIDTETFISWGVDLLKLDGCFFDVDDMKTKYTQWSNLLMSSGRPVLYSCSWPTYADLKKIPVPFEYVGEICNIWREWIDIRPNWDIIMNILDYQHTEGLAQYAGPGHWNDPDMLEIGNQGLSVNEEIAQFSLWAILAAPLIAGNDLRSMTKDTVAILTNGEVIEVNQDVDGIQGDRVYLGSDGAQVWYRPLQNGDRAVVMLSSNATEPIEIDVAWAQINLNNYVYNVRDLWLHKDIGRYTNSFSAIVEPHSVVMIRVSQ